MVKTEEFGRLSNGNLSRLYTVSNDILSLSVTDYGARAVSLTVPDRQGVREEVLLGYGSAGEYERDTKYLGATVGRCANRISGAEFSLFGKSFSLSVNDGATHLHGGFGGLTKNLRAKCAETAESVSFRLISPDGDEGYPANITVTATYSVKDSAVRIEYEACTDGDTLCSICNHAYFNLSGGREKIYSHTLTLNADTYLAVGPDCLPIKRETTHGGDFDFNRPRPIGHDYDNSFDIPGYTGVFRRAAVLECEMTGIRMTVSTDMPAVQLYTGAFLDGAFSPGDGVCLETQYPPNAVNSPFGPVPLLKKGEVYKFATEFSFSNF